MGGMINKFNNLWNNASNIEQVVIVIVLMITSPLWFFPAFLVFMVLLGWSLVDSAIKGFE